MLLLDLQVKSPTA